MFIVWTENVSLSATSPNPLIPLPFNSNGCRMHRFAPTAVHTASGLETLTHISGTVDLMPPATDKTAPLNMDRAPSRFNRLSSRDGMTPCQASTHAS
jgi:hypothetical protein